MSYLDAVARIEQITGRLQITPAASPDPGRFARELQAAQHANAAAPSTPTAAGAAGPAAIERIIAAKATEHQVDANLVREVVRAESGFDPDAGSPAGAQGLMQLMPATAAALGVTDINDPEQNVDGGVRYLKQQLDRFGGDVRLALAAYNAGPGAVEKYDGVPPYPETQSYVKKITARLGL